MKNMRNGTQKNSLKKPKELYKAIIQYSEKHKDDISKISALLIFSFVSALIIQEKIGIDYFFGSCLIVLIILSIFYKDIKRYKPAYLKNYKMLFLLGILVTSTLLLSRLFAHLLLGLHKGLNFPGEIPYLFGIPIPMGAMLVALIFDFHTAIIFSFVMSLLTGIWLGSPLFNIYVFIGSLTAAFSVIRCKKRSALIKGGMYVSAVNIITAGIILLLMGDIFSQIAPVSILFAAMSGIIVASIVSIVLPFIEYIFGISTDISLVELLDLDQPLMRRLMITAPGTYHHSVIVGNLAEAAAEVVGANPLLARVTAYYHDIGKIKMPDYFVENQSMTISKHDRLTPHMSSMILTSHVKEGAELARQYKLPSSVIDIIQQHHGTNLITYFYKKAIEQQPMHTLQEDYRYPGPKPQTKVAAIVMMADAVEAASRTLDDPTPARISALVDKVINGIFLDGQMDECDITLKDISEIKKRFSYILTGIFHKRVAYPEINEQAGSKKIRQRGDISEQGGNIIKKQPEADKNKSSDSKEDTEKGVVISQR